jgi:hypothetical protein
MIIQMLKKNKSFYNEVREDFTYHSSNIEGSTITREDHSKLANLKSNQNIHDVKLNHAAKENDLIENLNCLKLFDYVFDTIGAPLTHADIQHYQLILKKDSLLEKNVPEETGKYRKSNVSVGGFDSVPYYQI